ncbi:hypothetical protein [Oleiagrimonas sp. MCCC 1A03011]|uniref:hypothetical protein n=1 Tax=Oleiagrimonas sp. MCCC 1A03011 TaxID=1926883 RepID=UPI0011BF5BDF|nr:hypothetical protein [Oleiagrimonas sp. MCCC 1A03011]
MSLKSRWLKELGFDETRDDISAIGYTFVHGYKTLMELKFPSSIDEESMTGALLGAFATSFKPAVWVFGSDNNQKCSWARYRKSGKRPDSESVRGADFALVIAINSDVSRIAIFQAKKAKVKKSGRWIDVHHYPAGDPKRSSQIVSLFNTGKKILSSSGVNNPGLSECGWIHYLAYDEDRITHLPMTKFENEINSYSAESFDESLPVNISSFKSLSELLLAGCGKGVDDVDGWLTLSNDVLIKELPDLLNIMEVCVGDDGSGGLLLNHTKELEKFTLSASPSIPEPLLQPPSSPRRGPQ